MNRACAILTLLATLAAPALLKGAEGVSVSLLERAQVRGGYLKLSDIAGVTGDEALASSASALMLGKAPADSESYEISRWQVEAALLANGFTKEQMKLSGAEKTLVIYSADRILKLIGERNRAETASGANALAGSADAQTGTSGAQTPPAPGVSAGSVAQGQIRTAPGMVLDKTLEEAVNRLYNPQGATERYEAKFTRLISAEVPASKIVALEIENAPSPAGQKVVTVAFRALGQGGGRLGSVEAIFAIKQLRKVVVAKREVLKDALVAAEDVEETFVSAPAQPCYTRLDEVLGKRVKNAIHAGDAVKLTQVETPPLVRAGQTVQVKAAAGSFQVTQFVTALQSGCAGEMINVKNTRSGGSFKAIVLPDGTLELAVPGMAGAKLAALPGGKDKR